MAHLTGPGAGDAGPRSRVVAYAVALAACGVALGVSLAAGLSEDANTFPLLLAAVMVSAWYGGIGPGLLATALGGTVGTLLWLAPAAGRAAAGPTAHVPLGVFVLEALVICGLASFLHEGRRRAEATARRLEDLQSVSDVALAHLQLDDLLRQLIGRIRAALEADTVVILLLTEDETQLAVRAAHGLEQEVIEGVRIPVGRGIAGRIAARREPMLVEEVSAVEVASPILRARGIRSLLGVPLMVEGRVIGVVHVGTLGPRRFTDDETRVLRPVADRIALAIDHARLYEAERTARTEAELAEGRFRLLVDGVRDYALYLLDPDGRVVSWNAGAERLKGHRAEEVLGRHFSAFYEPEDVRAGVPGAALARAAAEGRHEDERWRVRRDGSRFWAGMVVTALRSDEGRLVGFATLTHDLTERRRAAQMRDRLLEQVISAQEEEQRRIARELHDETGQALTSLLVGLRALQDAPALDDARARAAELRRLAARTLEEVRRLSWGLRPVALDELGLVAALEQYAARYAGARSIAVEVHARGLDGARLPDPVETALYRIVQEALTNVAKHAGARTVSVVLQRQPEGVQAIVTDDGGGFDVRRALAVAGAGTHLGLHGMRERAALLDGEVTIESTPGEGTTVYARIPLAGRAHATDPSPDRG